MSENIVSSVEAPYDVAGPEAPAGTAADAAKTDKELPAGAGDAPVAEGGDAAAAKADDVPTDGTDAPAKKGCGSTLSMGLLAALLPAAWAALRKREG